VRLLVHGGGVHVERRGEALEAHEELLGLAAADLVALARSWRSHRCGSGACRARGTFESGGRVVLVDGLALAELDGADLGRLRLDHERSLALVVVVVQRRRKVGRAVALASLVGAESGLSPTLAPLVGALGLGAGDGLGVEGTEVEVLELGERVVDAVVGELEVGVCEEASGEEEEASAARRAGGARGTRKQTHI